MRQQQILPRIFFTLLSFLFFDFSFLYSQADYREYNTRNINDSIWEEDLEIRDNVRDIEQYIFNNIRSLEATPKTLPIVFHIVYSNSSEQI